MTGPKMGGRLPAGDGNGLVAILPELITDGKKLHVVIAIVDCRKVETDNDTGEVIPTVRVRRIEPVRDKDDMGTAELLMRRALDKRLGREQLPFDMIQDIEAAFHGGEPSDPEPGDE